MNSHDIEEIAEQLFKDLNHPKNAACREEVINRLKNNPNDFDGFLFETIEYHSMRKVLSQNGGVMISDLPGARAAVVKRWLEKIGAAGPPA